jgi:hypothetical protein
MNMTLNYYTSNYKSLYGIKHDINNISRYWHKIIGIENCCNQNTKLAICVKPRNKGHRCAKYNVGRYTVFTWNRN